MELIRQKIMERAREGASIDELLAEHAGFNRIVALKVVKEMRASGTLYLKGWNRTSGGWRMLWQSKG